MMEISEIGIDEATEYGYRLLKYIAEAEKNEFLNNAPITYAQLRQGI